MRGPMLLTVVFVTFAKRPDNQTLGKEAFSRGGSDNEGAMDAIYDCQ
jgi:hypothetical protein